MDVKKHRRFYAYPREDASRGWAVAISGAILPHVIADGLTAEAAGVTADELNETLDLFVRHYSVAPD